MTRFRSPSALLVATLRLVLSPAIGDHLLELAEFSEAHGADTAVRPLAGVAELTGGLLWRQRN